jgi:hypothetical protein
MEASNPSLSRFICYHEPLGSSLAMPARSLTWEPVPCLGWVTSGF